MEKTKKSGLAVAGLVLGIIGACLSFIPIINNLAFILGILAIIFTIISLIKRASKGQAIAGLILGIVAIIITIYSQIQLANVLNEVASGFTNEVENTFSVDQNSPDKMTLDKFNRIQTGMTYEQVVEIVGSEGTLSTENEYGNQSMKIYSWYASNGISNATVSFLNGKVTTKSQIGL